MSSDALLSKNLRESRSLQLQFQQKCQEFDVKPTLFPYNDLRLATQDFHKDMKLGDSGFGEVYKGVLPNGNVMADHILLDKGPRRQMLTWTVRLKICSGVAQGLQYLRAYPRIIHRDIKASNVFLDRNFDPKIGDFSLAFLFPDEQSHLLLDPVSVTKGYMAPEYAKFGELSDKADVYSFGVLCLEIISGRQNWEIPDQVYIQEWAWRLHEEDRLVELVDPALQLTDVEVRDVQRVIKVCLMCVQDHPKERPSMARIGTILQGDTELEGQLKRLVRQQKGLLPFASGSSLGSSSDGAQPGKPGKPKTVCIDDI